MTQLGLNTGGWIFIVVAWGLILFFTVFCFSKVLAGRSKKKEMTQEG